MISFRCACGRVLEAIEAEAGAALDCPWCGAPVVVPSTSTVVAAPSPTEPPAVRRRRTGFGLLVVLAAGVLALAGYAAWRAKERRDRARAQALYEEIVERCRAIPRVYLTEVDADALCASLRPLGGPGADAIAAEVEVARSSGELVERWLSASTRLDPDEAISLGFPPGRGLSRYGPEALRERAWLTATALRKARALEGESPVDRYLLLRWLEHDLVSSCGLGLDGTGDPGRPVPETVFLGIHASYDALLLLEGTKDAEFDLLADRLEQVPAVVEEVRRTMGQPSWDAVERTLALLPGYRELLARWREEAGDLADERRERIEKAARGADEVLLDFGDSLSRRRAPSAESGEGRSERVHFLVAGIEGSERSIADLVAVLEQIVSEGPTVEGARHAPPEATFRTYLGRLFHAVEEARRFVRDRDLLTIPRHEPFVVEEAPPHFRVWGAPAALAAFKFAENPRARIWVTPWDPSDGWRGQLEWKGVSLTAAHEAYPGHLASFVVSRDKASLLRRLYPSAWTPEGWATYSEQLALEEGLARSGVASRDRRLVRAGQALRALVLLAYAAGAASREEAEEAFLLWFAERGGSDRARRDLAFAAASPLSDLGYLVGERDILEMRESLRTRLGDRFRLKEFHDRFLAKGNTPLSLIRAELETEWK